MNLTSEQQKAFEDAVTADVTASEDFIEAYVKMEELYVPDIWLALASETHKRRTLEYVLLAEIAALKVSCGY